jgi:hypothetical protein
MRSDAVDIYWVVRCEAIDVSSWVRVVRIFLVCLCVALNRRHL